MLAVSPFNSEVDVALRSSVALWAACPAAISSQRLVYYDYLIVHSSDVSGPKSLHPGTPYRSGELVTRRSLVQTAIALLSSLQMIEISPTDSGFLLAIAAPGLGFVDSLESTYAGRLRERALWVSAEFGSLTDGDLGQMLEANAPRWGAEFEQVDLDDDSP